MCSHYFYHIFVRGTICKTDVIDTVLLNFKWVEITLKCVLRCRSISSFASIIVSAVPVRFFNELTELKLTLTELCLSKPYISKNVCRSAFLVLTVMTF